MFMHLSVSSQALPLPQFWELENIKEPFLTEWLFVLCYISKTNGTYPQGLIYVTGNSPMS
jgi:hypothetical protein